MPTEYSKTVPFTGHGARALDVARSTFVGQGFQIIASSDYELRVTGPGINSTRQNPLRGVSEASIIVRSSSIEMKAMLDGVQKMKRFMRFFPLAMGVFFLIVFGALAWRLPLLRNVWFFLTPVLALSPWIFLAPLIARAIERKTKEAVDTLLSNMMMIGSQP